MVVMVGWKSSCWCPPPTPPWFRTAWRTSLVSGPGTAGIHVGREEIKRVSSGIGVSPLPRVPPGWGGVGWDRWGTHPCRRVHGLKVNLEIVLRPGVCGVRGVSRDARGGDGGHKAAPPNPMGVTEDPPPTHPPLFWRVKLPGRLHVSGASSYHFCFIAFCVLETRGGGYTAGGHHQQVQPFPGPPPAPPPAPRKGSQCPPPTTTMVDHTAHPG